MNDLRLVKSPRKCERCKQEECLTGERYCLLCREAVLDELEASGYLTPLPAETPERGRNACEDIRQTKFGVD